MSIKITAETFPALCVQAGLPEPTPEFCFTPPRKWRFDWAFLTAKVALEIDGGVWVQGRHTRGSGFVKDMEKLNEAAAIGWRVLRCVPKDFESGKVIELLKRAML